MMLSSLLALLLPLAPAPKYPVSAIDPALRQNAHAVVRAYDQVVAVKSASQLVESVHQVITVLDGAGDDYGKLVVSYDALRRISYLRGAVYDANGQLLHQLRPAEDDEAEPTPGP